jgi:hypothetical protein
MPHIITRLNLVIMAASIITAMMAAYYINEKYERQEFQKEITEFELEFLGVEKYTDASFNLQYAFNNGFKEIKFSNITYTQLRPEIILITRNKTPKTYKYKVILDQRIQVKIAPAHYLPFLAGNLSIHDTVSSKFIAFYLLPHDRWPGSQAAGWLAETMNVDTTFALNKTSSIQSLSEVKILQPTAKLEPSELAKNIIPIIGCESSIEYYPRFKENGFGEIRSNNWTMARPRGLKGILCNNNWTFIIAGQSGSLLNIIWMSESGEIIGQGELHNNNVGPLSDHGGWLTRLELQGENLQIEQSHFRFPAPFLQPISAVSQVSFIVPLSALRTNGG